MDEAARATLERTIIAGLPGSEESFTSAELLRGDRQLCRRSTPTRLRANHVAFLEAVCPVADEPGHPAGRPSRRSAVPDLRPAARGQHRGGCRRAVRRACPTPSNGLCFCTGSFGVRADNDLPGMVERLGERIGFLHLRSVQREPDGAFHEAAHLERRRRHGGDRRGGASLCSRATGRAHPDAPRPRPPDARRPRHKRPIPAIRCSAGCAASPNCAGSKPGSSTPARREGFEIRGS